jgi:phage gpG-like protein
MTKLLDLVGFAAELGAINRDLEVLFGAHGHNSAIVEKACQIVQKKAKAAIGKTHEEWPALTESTIKDKQRHGYKTPAPLLRTGAMRDSIQYVVHGNEGCVGSDSEIAVFQELGTSRIPPRSFLVSSAIASEDKIHRMAAAATVAALSGHGHHPRDVRELLHLLHQAGHALYELGHDLIEDGDAEEGKR